MEDSKYNILSKANGATSVFRSKTKNTEQTLDEPTKSAKNAVDAASLDFDSLVTDALKSGRKFIIENPFKVATITLVLGLFTGSILTMAMRTRRT